MPRPDLDNPFSITGLARPRIHEAVADQIRQAIFNGLLLPGHKLLPEREMAEKFQTSRVALREALRALEKEGMITIRRGSGGGAFVADFDNALRALLDSLSTVVKLGQAKSAHLTETRAILEPEITRLATLRATPENIEAIEAVVVAQEKELAANNPVLNIVVNAVNESIRDAIFRSKRSIEMRSRVVQYHRNILEALKSKDAARARAVMTEHVVDVQCHLETTDHE
jgi:GntR family transcriptional repressor for pyruvate dehydrogenase complex